MGNFGNWEDWTTYESGKFISQVRIRDYSPTVGDNMGLTGLELYVCPVANKDWGLFKLNDHHKWEINKKCFTGLAP